MVNTRGRRQTPNGTDSTETTTPDMRGIIASEVREVMNEIMPGLFAQVKDELIQIIDQRVAVMRPHRVHDSSFRDFSACNPPQFEGKRDPILSIRWISDIEGAFRTSHCAAGNKVTYAVTYLRKSARSWWEFMLKKYSSEEIDTMTWEHFKEIFTEQFIPQIEIEKIVGEFLTMEQTTESVNDITDKFLEKATFCLDYTANEEMKMYRYLNILRTDIREFVSNKTCTDLNQMIKAARARELELERQQLQKRKQVQTSDHRRSLKDQDSKVK